MPYIKPITRTAFDEWLAKAPVALNAGELNYILTSVVLRYIKDHTISYETLNAVIGVLGCMNIELGRRLLSLYEDTKIRDNGDLDDFTTLVQGIK